MRNWSPFKNFTITYVGFFYDSFLEYSLFLWYTTLQYLVYVVRTGAKWVERKSSSFELVAK